jgi:hypothetical protein
MSGGKWAIIACAVSFAFFPARDRGDLSRFPKRVVKDDDDDVCFIKIFTLKISYQLSPTARRSPLSPHLPYSPLSLESSRLTSYFRASLPQFCFINLQLLTGANLLMRWWLFLLLAVLLRCLAALATFKSVFRGDCRAVVTCENTNQESPIIIITQTTETKLTRLKQFIIIVEQMALSRPPYLDPNTGKRYDTSSGSTEGWLTKQSEWLKDWRRRYFILKGDSSWKVEYFDYKWCLIEHIVERQL